MLMDVLGIVIGFAAVMLFLSLIVTAGTQVIQQLRQLRYKNLMAGLTDVLGDAAIKVARKPEDLAREVMQDAGLKAPTSRIHKIANSLAGGNRTWILPDELEEQLESVLKTVNDADRAELIAKAKTRFVRIEPDLSKRFAGMMRLRTIPLAFAVAILFQCNSFALLKQLSDDTALRAAYTDAAGQMNTGAIHNPHEYLEMFELELWPDGMWFFYGDGAAFNIFGTILTALALTFGAPFWFHVLGTAVGLRDVLKPAKKE